VKLQGKLPHHRLRVPLKTVSEAIMRIANTVRSRITSDGSIPVINSMTAIVNTASTVNIASIRRKVVVRAVKDSRDGRAFNASANGTSAIASATVSVIATGSIKARGMARRLLLEDRKMEALSLRLRRNVRSVRHSPAKAFLK